MHRSILWNAPARALAALLLLPSLAHAAPIVITSATRSVSRSVGEVAVPGEPPSNGGLPLATASRSGLGAFSTDMSTSYLAGDGIALDVAAFQQSRISSDAITLSTSTAVTVVDEPGPGSANDLYASSVSILDVVFEVIRPLHFVLAWDDVNACDSHIGCNVFSLEALGASQLVFSYESFFLSFPGGLIDSQHGTFEGDLAVGTYRLQVRSSAGWFVRERNYPGGALDLSLRFTPGVAALAAAATALPEPSAALGLTVALVLVLALAARPRRRS